MCSTVAFITIAVSDTVWEYSRIFSNCQNLTVTLLAVLILSKALLQAMLFWKRKLLSTCLILLQVCDPGEDVNINCRWTAIRSILARVLSHILLLCWGTSRVCLPRHTILSMVAWLPQEIVRLQLLILSAAHLPWQTTRKFCCPCCSFTYLYVSLCLSDSHVICLDGLSHQYKPIYYLLIVHFHISEIQRINAGYHPPIVIAPWLCSSCLSTFQ